MLKSAKKILAMTMASAMVVASAVTAFAAPAAVAEASEIQPRWSYITMIAGDLDISSSGVADVSVTVDAEMDGSVTKLTCKTELQQLQTSGWKTIKSWTETANDSSISYDKTYAVDSGYSYQILVTAKAYNGSKLLETATADFEYGYYN